MITAATARKNANEKNFEINRGVLIEIESLIKEASDQGLYQILIIKTLKDEFTKNQKRYLSDKGFLLNESNTTYPDYLIKYTISW